MALGQFNIGASPLGKADLSGSNNNLGLGDFSFGKSMGSDLYSLNSTATPMLGLPSGGLFGGDRYELARMGGIYGASTPSELSNSYIANGFSKILDTAVQLKMIDKGGIQPTFAAQSGGQTVPAGSDAGGYAQQAQGQGGGGLMTLLLIGLAVYAVTAD